MRDQVNREVCKKCKHLRHEEIMGEKRYFWVFTKWVVAGVEYYCELMPKDMGDWGATYPIMWIDWKCGTDTHDMPPPDKCPYLLEHLME